MPFTLHIKVMLNVDGFVHSFRNGCKLKKKHLNIRAITDRGMDE